ncbi:MAG: extracellular solute-binding protein [Microbacterium sp.]|nr:extracellular solute-binding protein [Microbacterium sp.]
MKMNTFPRRTGAVVAATTASALLLAACAGGGPSPTSSDEPAPAGGGQLLIIGPAAPAMELIVKDFAAKTGIDAIFSPVTPATEMNARIEAEQSAGKYLHDIILSTSCGILDHADWLDEEQPELENIGNLEPEYAELIPEIGVGVPWQISSYALLVNTDQVPEGSIESWWDLTDPKWSGTMSRNAMTLAGTGLTFFEASAQVLGRDFHEELAQQQAAINQRYEVAARQVAQGEYSMYFPFLITYAPDYAGLPVQVIIPEEGAPTLVGWAAKAKNAPNGANADLFLDYLLTDEAQQHVVETVHKSVTDNEVFQFNGEPVVDLGSPVCGPARAELDALAEEIYGAGN